MTKQYPHRSLDVPSCTDCYRLKTLILLACDVIVSLLTFHVHLVYPLLLCMIWQLSFSPFCDVISFTYQYYVSVTYRQLTDYKRCVLCESRYLDISSYHRQRSQYHQVILPERVILRYTSRIYRDPACCFPKFLETSNREAREELKRLWKPKWIQKLIHSNALKFLQYRSALHRKFIRSLSELLYSGCTQGNL